MSLIEILKEEFPEPHSSNSEEYNAIWWTLFNSLENRPKEEHAELALGILEEFETWTKIIKKSIYRHLKEKRRLSLIEMPKY